MNNSVAQTTIAIPVYNEVQFIERTLCSVIDQADLIIISDNMSTDGTSEICQKYASQYSHILYYKHENKQVKCNFLFSLSLATTEYFMWVGGHDLLPNNHVRKLKKIIDTTDAVLAYSNAVHLSDEYVFKNYYSYDYAEELSSESPCKRVFSVSKNLVDGTIFHGLYKKDFLVTAMKIAENNIESCESGVLAEIARLGKMSLCPDTVYYRISPRPDPQSLQEMWAGWMKKIHFDDYDPAKHIPEMIPIKTYFAVMQIAQKAYADQPLSSNFLYDMKLMMIERWAVNKYILDYIENNCAIDIPSEYFERYKSKKRKEENINKIYKCANKAKNVIKYLINAICNRQI